MIKLTGKRMHFTLANFHKKLPQLLCSHYSFKFQGSSFKFQTSFKEAVSSFMRASRKQFQISNKLQGSSFKFQTSFKEAVSNFKQASRKQCNR